MEAEALRERLGHLVAELEAQRSRDEFFVHEWRPKLEALGASTGNEDQEGVRAAFRLGQ